MSTPSTGQNNYPDNCLRGIEGADHVLEDGLVGTNVFYFKDDHAKGDGTFIESINWEDDDRAIPFTLAQRKQDGTTLQFKGGIAVIAKSKLDWLTKLPVFGDGLSYDREPLPDNPYHGNLILARGMSKKKRHAMAATMATHVTRIIRQPTS